MTGQNNKNEETQNKILLILITLWCFSCVCTRSLLSIQKRTHTHSQSNLNYLNLSLFSFLYETCGGKCEQKKTEYDTIVCMDCVKKRRNLNVNKYYGWENTIRIRMFTCFVLILANVDNWNERKRESVCVWVWDIEIESWR